MLIRRFLNNFFAGPKEAEVYDVATGSAPFQHPDVLPEAAQQLKRPCLHLKRTGTDFAAVWGGDGVVKPPPGPYRHWISVDSRYLQSGFLSRGVLSVYTNEEDCESGISVFSQTATLAEHNGEALYAHINSSLPPPDAIGDLDNEAYTKQWIQHCPVYNPKDDVVALLGGWHFPWPDGDWDEFRDRDLLVWTIEGSEPWVEVWSSDGGMTVMQRIT